MLPAGVRTVLEAVCILTGGKPIRKKDPGFTCDRYILDFWPASRKLLQDPNLLRILWWVLDTAALWESGFSLPRSSN